MTAEEREHDEPAGDDADQAAESRPQSWSACPMQDGFARDRRGMIA